jgi:GNAT superfamily N-acetyltransferase
VSDALHIRRLTAADLPFADQVREAAGWNQTLSDWERFLALEPDGCFLAEWEGAPAGTATTAVYASTLAWIGMVLVHPDRRRLGIGRALLQHCIHTVRDRGVRCVKLDATPAGQPVYEGLGFRAEWTLTRWMGFPSSLLSRAGNSRVRPWRVEDGASVDSLDARVFGVSRRRLFDALIPQCLAVRVVEDPADCLQGFGVLRPGSRALYLGPVIAASQQAAVVLVESLLHHADGRQVYWDLPDQNRPLVQWGERHGFSRQRPLTRMVLGTNTSPGLPFGQIALSGPETG